jgi:hypothetical protein
MRFTVTWYDRHQEPQMPPDPAYPDGIDLDVSAGATPTCRVNLAYPAKRLGYYGVICRSCGFSTVCTTAGRPDDPRSIRLPCRGLTRQ